MSAVKQVPNLASGRLLVRNTVWNLLGQVLPLAAGILVVPLLVRELNVDRFGLLSLVWIVIGYFGLFDLGIGRAVTKLVADKLGAKDEEAIPSLAWTSLLLMFLLGALGSVIMLGLSPWLIHRALKVPVALQAEALTTFLVLALSIPIVTVTSGLRGIMEAQQLFRVLNLIRIPTSLFSLLAPLLVLPFSHSLIAVISVLIAGRLLGCAAHLILCLHYMPALRHNFTLSRYVIPPLMKFGGWITIGNIVGPMILYSDRFLIGALLSVSVVSYYTVPFDAVSRLLIIPTATSGVLFPAFAITACHDETRTMLLLDRGMKYIFLITFPLALIIVTLAPDILQAWLGATFSQNSSLVLRWLAVGMFMNCLSVIPFTLLQSIGQPNVTGKLLLLEFPLSIAFVWILTAHSGITGAAIAWTLRATLETFALFSLSQYFLAKRLAVVWFFAISVISALLVFYFGTFVTGFAHRSVFLLCALAMFASGSWLLVLRPEERAFLMRRGVYRLSRANELA
jgi:O-antigen/teichoic acid export membrane protein